MYLAEINFEGLKDLPILKYVNNDMRLRYADSKTQN
jgi:hypothetical protein